jgi:hypothetical protein
MSSKPAKTSEWYCDQLFPVPADNLAMQMWTEHCNEYKLKHAAYAAQGILLDFKQIKISATIYSTVHRRYELYDTIIVPYDLDRGAPYIKAVMLRLAEAKIKRDEQVERDKLILCEAHNIFFGYHSELLK